MYWTGRVTLSSTGDNIFNSIGFQPTWIRARVSQKYGVAEICSHLSLGSADSINQNCSYEYNDVSGYTCGETNAKLISHWEKVGGILTEVISATRKSFDPNGFTITTALGNPNYKVHIECGN